MDIYLQGLTMGLAYVAPIGMQNIFVINNALTNSKVRALICALIVIFFDITLGLACFLGIGYILEVFPVISKGIIFIGSLLLLYIAYALFNAKPKLREEKSTSLPFAKIMMTAFLVTWCNPQAILDGTMMLGAFRATLPGNTAYLFIAGFASASMMWFILLTIAVSHFNRCISDKILAIINKICALIIAFYAVKLLLSFIKL